MESLSRFSILIALGCLVAVFYMMNQKETFSQEEQEQIQAIVERVIAGQISKSNSEFENRANRVIEEDNSIQMLQDKRENVDKLVNSGVRIVSDAQRWKGRPAAFGGGHSANGFEGLTLEKLGYPIDAGGRYETLHGICEIKTSQDHKVLYVYCSNELWGNLVQINVAGRLTTDIETRIMNIPLKED